MEKETIKIIVGIILFFIFGGLIALFTLVNLDFKVVKFSSIEGVIDKREELLELQKKLEIKENDYEQSKKKLEESKKSFTSAKNKYEAISDETINLIKEATTEENYDIEYMWIKLGNYASVNNLSIAMIEPGGTFTEVTNSNETKKENDGKKDETGEKSETENSNSVSNEQKNSDTLMTVVIEGSYLNVSDFIFEVENDKELRFKLDNIEMTYVSGTIIKAKFDVKNIIILK